jgi:hypothetical protein
VGGVLSVICVALAVGALIGYGWRKRVGDPDGTLLRIRLALFGFVAGAIVLIVRWPLFASRDWLDLDRLLLAASGVAVGFLAGRWLAPNAEAVLPSSSSPGRTDNAPVARTAKGAPKTARARAARAPRARVVRSPAVAAAVIGPPSDPPGPKLDMPTARERGLAIAVMALLLFLVAIEERYGLLRNLSKVSVASLTVEIAQSQAANSQRPLPDFTQTERLAVRPGTERIDYALKTLLQLTAIIKRDQEHYRLFSGDARSLVEQDPSVDSFRSMICLRVEPIINALKRLQDHYRSESPFLAIHPQIILSIRRYFYVHLTRADAQRSRAAAGGQLYKEFRPLDLAGPLPDEATIAQIDKYIDDEYRVLGFGARPAAECGPLRPSPASAATASPNAASAHLAYLAIFTALVELSFGHVEASVALLDKTLELEKARESELRNGLDSEGGEAASQACRSPTHPSWTQKRCELMSRQVTIVRLLHTKSEIMKAGRYQSRQEMIETLRDLESRIDEILQTYPKSKELRRAIINFSGECPDRGETGDNNEVFSRFAFARLSTVNNLLWYVSQEITGPSASAFTNRQRDAYAQEVADYAPACLQLLFPHETGVTQASFLDTLAAHEIAKVRLSLTRGEERDHRLQLCRAVDHWTAAIEIFEAEIERATNATRMKQAAIYRAELVDHRQITRAHIKAHYPKGCG